MTLFNDFMILQDSHMEPTCDRVDSDKNDYQIIIANPLKIMSTHAGVHKTCSKGHGSKIENVTTSIYHAFIIIAHYQKASEWTAT